jgi:hypothetical protein
MVEILNRELASRFADTDACNLELGLVDKVSAKPPDSVLLRCELGFNDDEPTRLSVKSHILHCEVQFALCLQMAYGAKETGDDIVSFVELELDHITLMKDNVWMLFGGEL